MQKIKNKFIISLILIIALIIWFWTYTSTLDNKAVDSYVLLVEWNATLNNVPIKKSLLKNSRRDFFLFSSTRNNECHKLLYFYILLNWNDPIPLIFNIPVSQSI